MIYYQFDNIFRSIVTKKNIQVESGINGIKSRSRFDIQYYSQCCGPRLFIPDPDFYPSAHPGSRIPDPNT
jgi:hypothetical protein